MKNEKIKISGQLKLFFNAEVRREKAELR